MVWPRVAGGGRISLRIVRIVFARFAKLVCAVNTSCLCAKVTFERGGYHFSAQTRRIDCANNMPNWGVAARNLRYRAHNHIYRRLAGKTG